MDIISALAGNPLPTSIAVLVSISAILGYYFFVIPLMESHKKLKEDHRELRDNYESRNNDSASEIASQLGDVETALHALRQALMDGSAESGEKLKEVQKVISDTIQNSSGSSREAADLVYKIDSLNQAVAKLNENLTSHTADTNAREDALERHLVEVSRSLSNVNEKQNQILGALLGMGRIQDRNRGI